MAERHLDTTAVTAGRATSGDSLSPVLFPSTTYSASSIDEHLAAAGATRPERYYSRFGSPTVREFEDAVAELEGAEAALAAASGMASIASVVLGLCSAGDHVVAARQLFSVSYALLAFHCPRLGIDVTFVDSSDPAEIAGAVRPGKTQVVLVESPANPALSLVDLDALGAIAGPFTVVDSTLAGPWVQRPLDHGVDLVVHAATKGIAGHNDALLGVVAGGAELIDVLWRWQSVSGAQASPFDAWNGIRGIRTLPIRAHRQCASALRLAAALERHPAVERVSYPWLPSHPQHDLARRQMRAGGTILCLEVAGGAAGARRFVESCRLARLALSLGGPETLLAHPATVAAQLPPIERAALGISDGLIRVSVGLEHPDDIEADLRAALDQVRAGSPVEDPRSRPNRG